MRKIKKNKLTHAVLKHNTVKYAALCCALLALGGCACCTSNTLLSPCPDWGRWCSQAPINIANNMDDHQTNLQGKTNCDDNSNNNSSGNMNNGSMNNMPRAL